MSATGQSNEVSSAAQDADLAYRQALQYGKDLAQVYVAERAQREKLEAAYQALNAVFASVPDAIVVLDETFIVRQANAAFEKLVNADEHILGQPLQNFLSSVDLMESLVHLNTEVAEE